VSSTGVTGEDAEKGGLAFFGLGDGGFDEDAEFTEEMRAALTALGIVLSQEPSPYRSMRSGQAGWALRGSEWTKL